MFTGIATAAMLAKKKEEPVFECPVCYGHFNRKFNRDRHMELMHKMPRPDLPPLYPNILKKPVQKPEESGKVKKSEEVKSPTDVKKPEEVKTPTDVKKPEEVKKPAMMKKSEKVQKADETMETNMENIPPVLRKAIPEKKIQSRPTKRCPQPACPAKKVKFMKPEPKNNEDDSMETQPEPEPEPQVTHLPIQNLLTGRTNTQGLTVHFCGSCDYANKHRYIILSNGHALVMVPVCEKCNELNMTMAKTIQDFKKNMK